MFGQNEVCEPQCQPLEQPNLLERIKREKSKMEVQLADLKRLDELFKSNPDLQEAMSILTRTNLRC